MRFYPASTLIQIRLTVYKEDVTHSTYCNCHTVKLLGIPKHHSCVYLAPDCLAKGHLRQVPQCLQGKVENAPRWQEARMLPEYLSPRIGKRSRVAELL